MKKSNREKRRILRERRERTLLASRCRRFSNDFRAWFDGKETE